MRLLTTPKTKGGLGREHRAEERRAFAGEVAILSSLGGQSVRARGIDISAGGCFLVTGLAFEVGEIVVLSIALPERPSLTAFGQIAHRRPAARGLVGYGIAFVELESSEQEMLRESCRHLPPPVPKAALSGVLSS